MQQKNHKRKYYLENIEIVLPSKKRKIITSLIIEMTTKEDISYSDDEEIRRTFPKNQEQQQERERQKERLSRSINTDDSDDLSEEEFNLDQSEQETTDNDSTITEKSQPQDNNNTDSDKTITSDSEESIDILKQMNKYDKIADELSKMNRYSKGEAMEEAIKDQLEDYGFIVTKTQSTARNGRIIGDNGIDHLAQIKINDQLIRLVIQSKNWKDKITGTVIRDLQGVLTNQYPERIGLIILNNGGIDTRAKNIAKNSKSTILIYNFNELKYLKEDLQGLQQQNRIHTLYQQVEEFEDIELQEQRGNFKRNIKARKYRRKTLY
jgi:Restriction endonuclease